MRHAKSDWDDPTLDDHERPLNRRGREGADLIATVLTARGYPPDTIWTSSAVRTRETATRLMRAIPGPQTVQVLPDFYHASADTVLRIIAGEDEPTGRLMLMGHNPGWQVLVEHFTGQVRAMPTAGTLVLKRRKSEAEWWERQAWAPCDWLAPKELGGR